MKRVVFLAVAAFCLIGLSEASAATLYVQSNVLRSENGACTGANRGKCTISELGTSVSDNVKVKCTIKGLNPNQGFTLFWTCTTGARGCHNQACGFIDLGNGVTSGTGAASISRTLGNNPFPGNYVHLDVVGAGGATAVYAGIPIGIGPAAANASAGDPTR